MNDIERQIDLWLDGDVDFDDLPPEIQKAVDAFIADVEKAQPTSAAVHEDTVDWTKKKKRKKDMDLVHKSIDEQRFTLGPWYIPNRPDAHNEWTDADELQKALWEYVRSGDRNIRLQHNKDIVAGEWLEAMSFPIPITMNVTKANATSAEVTYPEGTVFLGVQWKPWAWDLVKSGKITGFSIGGNAARVEMAIPAGLQKNADEDMPLVMKIKGRRWRVLAFDNAITKDKTVHIAGLYGDNGEVVVVKHDGTRYFAEGHSALAGLDDAYAQVVFGLVHKKSFKGNRSEAGRYAANIRWQRAVGGEYRQSVSRGPLPEPTTAEGKMQADMMQSLVGHCDLDAAAADWKAAGKKPDDPMDYEFVRPHLTPERAALHDKIIEGHFVTEDGERRTPPAGQPQYVFMGGGPAAGKSTMLADGQGPEWAGNGTNRSDRNGKGADKHSVAINADEIKGELPEYKTLIGTRENPAGPVGRKGQRQAASVVHEESSMISKAVNDRAVKEGLNVMLDGTGDASPDSMSRKIAKVRGAKAGYSVTAIYATVPTAVAVQRANDRGRPIGQKYKREDGSTGYGQGRHVASSVVIGTHRSVSQTLPVLIDNGAFDSVKLFDTTAMGRPRLLISGGRGKPTKITDQKGWDEFVAKGQEQ